MKMLVGNALLAVILVGWYFYIQGDSNWGPSGGTANPHVQALRNSDESSSEKTIDEHVRALQHVGDNNWMISGAVMAFASYLAGIGMGYWLRGPGKSRRIAQRAASEPAAAVHVPDAIPVAQFASAAEPVAAVAPVEEVAQLEPDIPGPDDLDELEESKPSIVVHSIVLVADNPPAVEQSAAQVENESQPA
jgi:hypothetical protein